MIINKLRKEDLSFPPCLVFFRQPLHHNGRHNIDLLELFWVVFRDTNKVNDVVEVFLQSRFDLLLIANLCL